MRGAAQPSSTAAAVSTRPGATVRPAPATVGSCPATAPLSGRAGADGVAAIGPAGAAVSGNGTKAFATAITRRSTSGARDLS